MQLIIDNRTGVQNQDIEIYSSEDKIALELLSKLDGNQHTMLSLKRKDGWQLIIGGGPAHYIITLGDGEKQLTFLNINGDEATDVEVCAGGQFGQFPETLCADHRQATEIISAFFDKQEMQKTWI